ncbi:MAG: hypothetical protein KGR26_12295, partial [Cyanobacteria bacterium REEB65]|nr:hypothetical protein [Cyanobacteria bacterium REEB65]
LVCYIRAMPLRRVGKALGFPKRRIVRVLPEPWAFDFDRKSERYNRWIINSLDRDNLTVQHVATRKRLKLKRDQIEGSRGPNFLLLAVQIALFRGIIELLPLPPGYWG